MPGIELAPTLRGAAALFRAPGEPSISRFIGMMLPFFPLYEGFLKARSAKEAHYLI